MTEYAANTIWTELEKLFPVLSSAWYYIYPEYFAPEDNDIRSEGANGKYSFYETEVVFMLLVLCAEGESIC